MTTATSTLAGTRSPATGRWQIDPSHSGVEFSVRHMGLSRVRGRFGTFSGVLSVAEGAEDSSVEVRIDAASIDTGDATRDDHLRSPDFLDVERHPSLEFRSTSVKKRGEDWEVVGDLSIHGVTRPVVLETTLAGVGQDPWGSTRVAFSGRTRIDREDFGLTWNQVLETGGLLVSKAVNIDIEVEAVYQDAA